MGSITVCVYNVLPNGVLDKRREVVKLNQGDEYIHLTGNVRVDDIQAGRHSSQQLPMQNKNYLCWPRLVLLIPTLLVGCTVLPIRHGCHSNECPNSFLLILISFCLGVSWVYLFSRCGTTNCRSRQSVWR
ncbi:flagellar basal body L-ring protein FlgH [Vibrio chagasii]|nr:flagellar basal body L-ring protein FlgH [Vibrio chagasii]